MGLFKPAYFNKDRTKREAALGKLPQAQLKQLFLGDLSSYSKDEKEQRDFRLSCLSRISEQQFLAQVVASLNGKTGGEPFVKKALQSISDERLLYALLKQCQLGWLSGMAVQKLQDPQLLRAVALDASMSDSLRADVLARLQDAALSAQLVRANESDHLRGQAAAYLDENDGLLADELAQNYLDGNDSCDKLAMFGFKNCRDERLKAQLLQKLGSFSNERLTAAALDGFSEALLLQICQGGDKQQYRREALLRLKQPDSLWLLLSDGCDDDMACAVYSRLGDIGSQQDVCRLAQQIDDERHEYIVRCISLIEKCSAEEVLAKYGTEATAAYYLARLHQALGTAAEQRPAAALRALYRAGKGQAALEPLRGKTLHAHIDDSHSSCTPGWGHSDSHDDIPALRF